MLQNLGRQDNNGDETPFSRGHIPFCARMGVTKEAITYQCTRAAY